MGFCQLMSFMIAAFDCIIWRIMMHVDVLQITFFFIVDAICPVAFRWSCGIHFIFIQTWGQWAQHFPWFSFAEMKLFSARGRNTFTALKKKKKGCFAALDNRNWDWHKMRSSVFILHRKWNHNENKLIEGHRNMMRKDMPYCVSSVFSFGILGCFRRWTLW